MSRLRPAREELSEAENEKKEINQIRKALEGFVVEGDLRREVSMNMRQQIREYGVNNFSWENIVKPYIQTIEKMEITQ